MKLWYLLFSRKKVFFFKLIINDFDKIFINYKKTKFLLLMII